MSLTVASIAASASTPAIGCTRSRAPRGLLRFEFGQRAAAATRNAQKRNNETSLLGRARWALPFSFLGMGMFAWGIWSYEPYHLSVDHGSAGPGQTVTDYQIAIANKRYHDGKVQVRVSGIDPQNIHLSAEALTLGKVEHKSLTLSISPQVPRGLYRVQIEVRSSDGWVGRTSIQHLAG